MSNFKGAHEGSYLLDSTGGVGAVITTNNDNTSNNTTISSPSSSSSDSTTSTTTTTTTTGSIQYHSHSPKLFESPAMLSNQRSQMSSSNPLLVGVGYENPQETEYGDDPLPTLTKNNQHNNNSHHSHITNGLRNRLHNSTDNYNLQQQLPPSAHISSLSSSTVLTSVPLNSPNLKNQPPTSTYIHPPHSSQIPDTYLSILGASHGAVIKKKRAAVALKDGRKWLTYIIIIQTVGNLIRALPIFILERYYVMLLIFIQALFLILGSYGVKRLKKYLILLYTIGCFGTTVMDLIITFTYAHHQNQRPFNEAQVAFWSYVLFVALLCTLNITGGIVLGLKMFVSLHTLSEKSHSGLVLLAANMVGSFEGQDDEDAPQTTNGGGGSSSSEEKSKKANRAILYYGSDVEKAKATMASYSVGISWYESIKTRFLQLFQFSGSTQGHPLSAISLDFNSHVKPFASNEVITSKYNVITFFPKVIFYQFSRLANLYTLCIVILCMFSFSPVGPISSVTPLLVVISVSCFKELVEDIKRHRQDKEINNRLARIYRPPQPFSDRDDVSLLSSQPSHPTRGDFESASWKDIRVGDIILVKDGELLPADIICLSTSRNDGRTYLETANLDGETNLKLKTNIQKCGWIKNAEDLDKFSCKVDYEGPNNDIYGFEGVLTILKGAPEPSTNNLLHSTISGATNYVPVSIEQFLLRGTKLRNTEWVIGIVTYTGVDTKVEMNSTKSSQKRSSVERSVNNKLLMLFLLQTLICITCSIGHNRWHLEDDKEAKPWYIGNTNTENDFIYVSYVILYNTLIPLSMYVSMEVIRVSNAHFIDSDLEMYDATSDTPAQARNTNINEELGQIQYLFSDKTGTLTCNEMVFNRCTIGGKIYGPNDISTHILKDLQSTGVTPDGEDNGLVIHDNMDAGSDPISIYLKEFLICLAICNTVVIEKNHKESGADLDYVPTKAIPKYQASSPDEEALTIAAARFGVILKSREDNIITISYYGKEERYELLNTLEFNSYRKRMSVIVRTESGQIRLYTKGADNVILERSDRASPMPFDMHAVTEAHLSQFATCGLRTLCMAMSILDTDHYIAWSKKYDEAAVSLSKRAEKIDQAAELIEKNLVLLGATGIEDRLQDNVPETIQSLREAGIKVWVLTGDKQETAISIATSSSVLSIGMELIILNESSKEGLMKRLLDLVHQKRLVSFNDSRKWGPDWIQRLARKLKLEPSDAPSILNRTTEKQIPIALVIDGSTLQLALDKDLRYHFLQVAKSCESVVCCRCSPSQKAKVVKLVSERSFLFGDGAITMSIGDGANDVPMIQKAHVGVGISGREGMQAVLASDFAIAQFQMLRRLLFVHGHRSYKRMTKLILYSFAKNIALSISQFWFGFFSAFSGQMIYFDFLFTLYNALFTSLPVLMLGTFDQDASDEELISKAYKYRISQSNKPFSTRQFFWWVFVGMWQSAIIFFVTFFALQSATIEGGKTLGLWSFGTAAYLYLILTVNLQISFVTRYWTRNNIWATAISVIASIVFVIIYSVVYWIEPEAQYIIFELFTVPYFWLLYIIVPCISLLPFVIVHINGWMFSHDEDHYYGEKDGFIALDDSSRH
ncbi:P-type ATPase [Cavenderia fasciculata]|uniref:Phospholipid-transporting ATPase n=1 Tax=Cavenderia fasciculata TaxID=261658 RepID=F4Q3W1_CACFS|nr:P-type ATPase [Cavenderia fasciculata]EGG17717.1 P-type ATPase [Cavenderia fasciculata]|eukprot:XP_004356201.1 P-type ATPase [Cavenderia fasciculata]